MVEYLWRFEMGDLMDLILFATFDTHTKSVQKRRSKWKVSECMETVPLIDDTTEYILTLYGEYILWQTPQQRKLEANW